MDRSEEITAEFKTEQIQQEANTLNPNSVEGASDSAGQADHKSLPDEQETSQKSGGIQAWIPVILGGVALISMLIFASWRWFPR